MKKLIRAIAETIEYKEPLPFSVYSAYQEQVLLNVPITKPLLIVVLEGEKILGQNNEFICRKGEFIFLANNPALNMRNIPKEKNYFALLIEFSPQDFEGLQQQNFRHHDNHQRQCVIGETSALLNQCLQQFVEICPSMSSTLRSLRKREIIKLLCEMGHQDILSLLRKDQIKDKLHSLFIAPGGWALSITELCDTLAMSESTLRRKLKLERSSVQEIKDLARLGLGLHLLQTTNDSISFVAEQCGYQSQSRFTARFKSKFGLTPTALRKTKMKD